jgi:hypothetical protein
MSKNSGLGHCSEHYGEFFAVFTSAVMMHLTFVRSFSESAIMRCEALVESERRLQLCSQLCSNQQTNKKRILLIMQSNGDCQANQTRIIIPAQVISSVRRTAYESLH